MRKIIICEKKMRTDSGETLTLVYSITVDALLETPPGAELESYGTSICIHESGEECSLRHITTASSEIFSLTELLSANLVTPLTLPDVVYDWLCR